MNTIAEKWLKDNKAKFQTLDGLPGAYHREVMFGMIKNGTTVVIETPHGSLREGHAVMRGPAGWVLNLGGQYGTPGIASEENVVYVAGASKILDRKPILGAQCCFRE